MIKNWLKLKKLFGPFCFFNFLGSMIIPLILILLYPNFKLDFYRGDPFDFFFNYTFVSAGLLSIFGEWQMDPNPRFHDHKFVSTHDSYPTFDQRTDYVNNPIYSSMPGNNHCTSPFSNISSTDISKSPFNL